MNAISIECNSDEETYYKKKKKNRDVILNRGKDYYKNDKERLREQGLNTEIYLNKKKIKRGNMEEKDTIICQKKRNKD